MARVKYRKVPKVKSEMTLEEIVNELKQEFERIKRRNRSIEFRQGYLSALNTLEQIVTKQDFSRQ